MSKQLVDIGTQPNDGTGDPLRTSFDKINDNINEIYSAIGDGTDAVGLINNNDELELTGIANKISFYYSTEANLLQVPASTYHGCIGHAHDTGALYYAHGGTWHKLLTDTSNTSVSVTNYDDPVAPYAFQNSVTNSEVDTYVLQTNADGTYTWVDPTTAAGTPTTLVQLSDVSLNNLQVNQILKWNGSLWVNGPDITGSGGGASTFIGLNDTPSLMGASGQFLRVNGSGDALEFTAAPSGGGGGAATRANQAVATASIADGAIGNISFNGLGVSYVLLSIQVSGASWVRIYTDDAARTADASRPQGDDPTDGDGVVAEIIAGSADTFKIAPGVIGWVDGQTTIPVAVKNNTGSTSAITVTINALVLES